MPQIDNTLESQANELFHDCALFAAQFFELPSQLAVGLENYTPGRFHHELTPSLTVCEHGTTLAMPFSQLFDLCSLKRGAG
jgi:hypothetical protein